MAVVRVYAPALQHAFHVAILARTPNVIDDLSLAILHQRLANARGNRIERLIPGDALPLALATLAHALQWIEDAFGIVDLVERRRAFGAGAPATARMGRIPLELAYPQRFDIDIGQQSTRGLTIEAGGRSQRVRSLDALRPGFGVQLRPAIPLIGGWIGCQLTHWGLNGRMGAAGRRRDNRRRAAEWRFGAHRSWLGRSGRRRCGLPKCRRKAAKVIG